MKAAALAAGSNIADHESRDRPLAARADLSERVGRHYVCLWGNAMTESRPSVLLQVEEGKPYAVCRCGRSGRAPLCDGSHMAAGAFPIFFKAEQTGEVRVCLCGKTNSAPYCDCAAAA